MKLLVPVLAAGLVLPGAFQAWSAEEVVVRKAITFLEREVSSWRKENGCFSCHNNGDGARALYLASRKGETVEMVALAGTTGWLKAPGKWHENKGDPGFSDKRLPVIQFGAALAASGESSEGLKVAVQMLKQDQEEDGSWRIEGQRESGSPAAYGNDLATCMAILVIEKAEGEGSASVRKGRAWFMERKLQNVVAAASALLALRGDPSPGAEAKKSECQDYLLRAQGSTGGWGPYPDSPPESFDTSLALLALGHAQGAELRKAVERGRKFLLEEQEPDGGWPETTRPTGGESYAQRISTTGWVLIALLGGEPI